jgi:hypothetical protein
MLRHASFVNDLLTNHISIFSLSLSPIMLSMPTELAT